MPTMAPVPSPDEPPEDLLLLPEGAVGPGGGLGGGVGAEFSLTTAPLGGGGGGAVGLTGGGGG